MSSVVGPRVSVSKYLSRRFDSPNPCCAGFAVSFLFLPQVVWFCRGLFGFAVSFLLLP